MSDRIAVFNEGRIEQVGTPAEVYEQPATRSWPASSARRTCSRARPPRPCSGRDERVSVRPEKIRLAAAATQPGEGEHAVHGTVREVVYVGMATRFVVDLEVGGSLWPSSRTCDIAAGSRAHARPAGAARLGHASTSTGRRLATDPPPAAVRSAAVRNRHRRMLVHSTRLLKIAAVSAAAALMLAACGGCTSVGSRTARRASAGRPALRRSGRRRRGPGQHPRVARLRRGRLDRPGRRLGHPVRDRDRLRGQPQDVRHLRRGREAHAGRRLGRRLRIG